MTSARLASGEDTKFNTLSVTALLNLEVSDLEANIVHIERNLFLVSHRPTLEKLLQPKYLAPIIGSLEMDLLLSGRPVLVQQSMLRNASEVKIELVKYLYTVQRFVDSFWLQQDCSVNHELAFTMFYQKGGAQVDSNLLTVRFSDAKGSSSTLTTTIDMVQRSIHDYFLKFQPVEDSDLGQLVKLTKSASRFQIANLHFHSARSADTLELKISNYCAGFEAILSTSSAELSHQLSERIAVLLETETNKRLELYRNSKRVYGIRSKVVHGTSLANKDEPDLPALCTKADTWARELSRRYLADIGFQKIINSLDSQDIDSYFLGLLFA